jgi:hypothetical protein
MANSTADAALAARDVCGSYEPPHLALCVVGANDRSNDHHDHHHSASLARRGLEATGATVAVVHSRDVESCPRPDGAHAVVHIPAGHVWALQRFWPFCFYAWRKSANLTFATEDPRLRHHAEVPSSRVAEEERAAPCASSAQGGVYTHRLALGLGGLARTFPHPLVYTSLRAFVIEPWTSATTTVAVPRLSRDGHQPTRHACKHTGS